MTRGKVRDSIARPLRTGPQGGAAWAFTEGIDAFLYDLNDRQYGIAVVLLTMLFSFVQARLENRFNVSFLRDLPPEPQPIVGGEHRA